MQAKLQEVKEELRRRMHRPIPEQGKWLRQVVSGFFNYHAVPTNIRALAAFRHSRHRPLAAHAAAAQPEGPSRRGTGSRRLVDDWLPKPRILHPWPSVRFAVKHPRWEPYAGCERKAGMSLPVQVWSVQSRAGGTGAKSCGRHGDAGSEA